MLFAPHSSVTRHLRTTLFSAACALLLALIALAAVPSHADAQIAANYTGWAYVESNATTAPAWHWNAAKQSWSAEPRPTGIPIYASPWTSSWTWTWTSDTGWLAMPTASVTTNSGRSVFDDEFNANSLNLGNWKIDTGDWGYGREACFSKNNVRTWSGNLLITGARDSCDGRSYSSGNIESTHTLPVPTAGHPITMTASVAGPCGSGAWPAFWTTGVGSTWPTHGEIDMIELFGNHPNGASQTVHMAKNGANYQQKRTTQAGYQWCSSYHLYGAVLNPDSVTFTLDGAPTATFTKSGIAAGAYWPFAAYPQHLIFTLALGANAGTIDNSALPGYMWVDWVHVTQA